VFQNPIDKSKPTPPTIIKMIPIMWRLKPVVVTEMANRIIAPTAKMTRLVPIPMVMPFLLDGSDHNEPVSAHFFVPVVHLRGAAANYKISVGKSSLLAASDRNGRLTSEPRALRE
jgi:hypothetical protein